MNMRAWIAILTVVCLLSPVFAQQPRCSYSTDGLVWPTLPTPHRVIWCEDFDNYCVGGAEWLGYPPYPDKCPETGSTPSNAALYQKWPLDDTSSPNYITQALGASATQAKSLPFTLMLFGGQTNYRANRSTHNFGAAVQQVDPTKNAVNGTDAKPLVLEATINFAAPEYGESTDPYYIELMASGDQAPVDYFLQPCYNNPTGDVCNVIEPEPNCGPWPTICQQYRPVAPGIEPCIANVNEPCGPLKEEIHASIAFGSLAWLDPSPADRQSTGRKPTRDHVVIFDGKAWRELRSSVYPGTGNFSWRENPIVPRTAPYTNRFRLTVKTFEFSLEHWNASGMYSAARIPRQYTGPFDTVAVGTGNGCEIDPATHECKGPREPIGAFTDQFLDRQGRGWWNADVDNLILLDGVTASIEGACCNPDGTCSVVPNDQCFNGGGSFRGARTTCEAMTCSGACCGTFGLCTDTWYGDCESNFRGLGTSCATTGCPCSVPWADSDQDQDVDAMTSGDSRRVSTPWESRPAASATIATPTGWSTGRTS